MFRPFFSLVLFVRSPTLGGRQSIKKRHNQPYDSVGGGGLFEMRRYCGGAYGGDDITSFGRRINRRKLMKEKIRRGLRRPPNDKKKHNNQPKTHGLDGGETRYEAQPAGARWECKLIVFGRLSWDSIKK